MFQSLQSVRWPSMFRFGSAAARDPAQPAGPASSAPPKRRRRSPWVAALRELVYRYIGIRVRQRKVRASQRHDPDTDSYLRTHVCLKPFQNLDTTNRGHAHVCCPDWLPTPIGNLDSDLLQQWSGPIAKKIRDSVTDGSYTYCSRLYCSAISNRSLPHRESDEVRETLAAFAASGETAPPPLYIGLSHDRSCNLSCPTCRTEPIVADKKEQAKLDGFVERSILPLLRAAQNVYVTGSGDPFGSAHFRRVLKRLDRQEFPHLTLDLHTNAQLFDSRAWAELDLAGRVRNVHISIDAAEAETYAIVRRGGQFAQLRKNLAFIAGLRQSGAIRSLEFSMVVQTRNFREMPGFVRLGQEFSADSVSFQMIRNWGTFSAAEFRDEWIGDPAHPRHPELVEILRAPELALPIARVGNILGYTRESAAAPT
ncbi:radical SAM protein [Methylovirgula sp. HY1]|uniref:radical SAM protein n=1 Tax=Methylovirgula sp. HY1 TaxID=2822761 RepID=UPI001C5B8B27|nr:radical SAM protein [Methylovirgula sp. HY1]